MTTSKKNEKMQPTRQAITVNRILPASLKEHPVSGN